MEELKPIGVLPPNVAIQTMTSYCGNVVLFALTGFRSKNMSTTTSAVASMAAKSSPASALAVMDQDTSMFRAERFESEIGSRSESNRMLGNA